MGRTHKGKTDQRVGGASNCAFADGHVKIMTVIETIEQKAWGTWFFTLTGDTRVAPPPGLPLEEQAARSQQAGLVFSQDAFRRATSSSGSGCRVPDVNTDTCIRERSHGAEYVVRPGCRSAGAGGCRGRNGQRPGPPPREHFRFHTLKLPFGSALQATNDDAIDADGTGTPVCRLLDCTVEQLPSASTPPRGVVGRSVPLHRLGQWARRVCELGNPLRHQPHRPGQTSPRRQRKPHRAWRWTAARRRVTDWNGRGTPARPFEQDNTTTFEGLWSSPGTPSGGGVGMDMAVMDVPTKWFITQPGTANPTTTPLTAGYGNNLKDKPNSTVPQARATSSRASPAPSRQLSSRTTNTLARRDHRWLGFARRCARSSWSW